LSIRQGRDEEERREYQQFLNEFVVTPRQLVYLDETAKGRNASRLRRSWFKRGRQPFRDTYFEDHNSKRYTMIAACDINGFIIKTCEIIERERGVNDRDETRGTVRSGFACGSRKNLYRCWVTFQ
jgi:hypothetical protein